MVAEAKAAALASAHGHAFGTHKAHIGDAQETQHHAEVAFLVLLGAAPFRGRVHAATAQRHDHGLATDQAGRGVFEGAAHLADVVNPRLELGGNGEVVQRRADHDHIGRQKLQHQLFRNSVFSHLRGGQGGIACRHTETQRFSGQVARRGHGQVLDRGARVAGLPLRADLGGEGRGEGIRAQALWGANLAWHRSKTQPVPSTNPPANVNPPKGSEHECG